jgi:hypothetical protein
MVQNFTDRVAVGFGSEAAKGRLHLSAATDELISGWARYAGRKGINRPTVQNLIDFLRISYGIEVPAHSVSEMFGTTASQTVDVEAIMPRIGDVLIDAGLIEIEHD